MVPERTGAARDLLAFYTEAGVDALIGEEPVDRFASVDGPAPATSTARGAATLPDLETKSRPATPAPPAPDEAAMAARAAAKSARTLEELRGILETFEGCALKATATQLVFADGNPA